MSQGERGRLNWRRWTPSIVVGATVGVVTGFIGLYVTELLFSTSAGGFVGAVGCGVAVAYHSDERLPTVVGQALIADVLSSIAVFVLVYLAYVTMVSLTEGFLLIGAIWFALMYLVFGGLLAVPVAIISLGITGVAATLTSLIKQLTANSSAPS